MENVQTTNLRLKQILIRLLSAGGILFIISFFTPKFNNSSYPQLFLFSIFIVIVDYLVATISGIHDIPLYRCIVSFVSCIIIIYLAQFFVAGFYISMLSSIIAAIMYATIQYFLPNK